MVDSKENYLWDLKSERVHLIYLFTDCSWRTQGYSKFRSVTIGLDVFCHWKEKIESLKLSDKNQGQEENQGWMCCTWTTRDVSS